MLLLVVLVLVLVVVVVVLLLLLRCVTSQAIKAQKYKKIERYSSLCIRSAFLPSLSSNP